jgi:helicase
MLALRVGFHNADLAAGERRAVEQSFRFGETRVLVATGTLAMGVNLPTDVVIIADTRRFTGRVRGQWRSVDISVAEYKNYAGRAGRLGQRTGGLAIVLAPRDFMQRQLLDFYRRGDVEPVRSQLAAEQSDDVIFDILCAGLAENRTELVEFIAATLAYVTFYV